MAMYRNTRALAVVIAMLLCAALSCSRRSEFPRPKPGAWEVVSSFTVNWEGVTPEFLETYNSEHSELQTPRTSRICISGSKEETKLFESIPAQVGRCMHKVTKQSSMERIVTSECEAAAGKKTHSTYQFRFSNDDSYDEIAQSITEIAKSTPEHPMLMKTNMTNNGKYLGPDCKALGASRMWGEQKPLDQSPVPK